jgi:hypothetical protein
MSKKNGSVAILGLSLFITPSKIQKEQQMVNQPRAREGGKNKSGLSASRAEAGYNLRQEFSSLAGTAPALFFHEVSA